MPLRVAYFIIDLYVIRQAVVFFCIRRVGNAQLHDFIQGVQLKTSLRPTTSLTALHSDI